MSQTVRIVHVIARMNVGGPAVLISDTLRYLDREEFEERVQLSGYAVETVHA